MTHSSNLASLQIVDGAGPKGDPLGTKLPANSTSPPELIDSEELARRLALPVSWIRSRCRARTTDEIPCVRFGRYCRFDWASPKLQQWIRLHEVGRG
jgi:hypothetical protein